ncbi:MAG: hydroxyacid dehydrogenase [Betaproteobacteria bacterium RIFCSPLOWO2_02_FULL_67_26]|nr:MAG: hydroxyacid dehydrogenase [Betaproteobacteria bacterium RIFCSPLOWO2_02_FULL_67_26]
MPDNAKSSRKRPGAIDRIRDAVGAQGLLTDPREMAPHVVDWRGLFHGRALAVARPANVGQVASVVKICAETRTAVVPQGGNTGMCGASVPDAGGGAIVLNLGRMNRIQEVDALNNTISVEAGCILANVQQAAREAGRLFPLSLGAEGSCQIGGNLSTNAGGVNVLRYGNTRELVLGLEVVLPDGRVWDGMRGLRKDNTGYDLKQVFIGAEGTLGVITAAVLKLFPLPRSSATAWIAVASPESALELLALLRQHCGDKISAFELISRNCLDLVVRHIPGARDPLPAPHGWYVLTDLGDAREGGAIRGELEQALGAAMERGPARDAVIAESQGQSQALWKLRESIPEAARAEPEMLYRHDIAVAVSSVPAFIGEARAALDARFPGVNIICFGHLGDGNLHYNVFVPGRRRDDAAARDAGDVTRLVYDIALRHHGSFSAEHGIGQSKLAEIARYKSGVELAMMRALKHTFDPNNIMNPGKVLPD